MFRKIIVLITILPLALQNLSAQEIDSISIYELEPAHITSTKDDIDFTTLNYFSKKNALFRSGGVYPVGIYCDSSRNFGVKFETKKNNNHLIMQEAVFLIHVIDTVNIKVANFYVLVQDSTKNFTKIDLDYTDLSFIEHPFYNHNSDNLDSNKVYLTQVKFKSTVIPVHSKDELYFMKEDNPPSVYYFSSMMFVTSKKSKSYYYKNNNINTIEFIYNESKLNPVWQVRLKYCEYYKED